MLCKRSKLQPARVPAPETSYEEYVKMSKKSRIVNRQKAHVFKDRFGDVDPINTKLYYDKIRQNAVDQPGTHKLIKNVHYFDINKQEIAMWKTSRNMLWPYCTMEKPSCGYYFSRQTDNRKILGNHTIPLSANIVRWRTNGVSSNLGTRHLPKIAA